MKVRILLLAVLIAAFAGMSIWLNRAQSHPEEVEIGDKLVPKKHEGLRKATMDPGRVLEIQTSKGEIDIVLFEKDCPKTTARIAKLAADGAYDNVGFKQVVRNNLIQTNPCKGNVMGMGCEILDGLDCVKGAVGMARNLHVSNSITSDFFILLEPRVDLNQDFTVFGRLIKGMDVAMSIRKKDVIRSTRIREFTPADKKLYDESLTIEAERKVN